MTNETNNLVSIFTHPHFGIATTGGTTVLWLIGVLTPYVAFAGLCLGLAASIYTIVSTWKSNRREQAEFEAWKKKNF